MFCNCYKLKEIKGINKFITNKVGNMRNMFSQCKELEYLDLSSFNTYSVLDMSYMFNGCYNFKEIKGINNFKFNNETKIESMFTDCNELEYLDLPNYNTENIFNKINKYNSSKDLSGISKLNINIFNVFDDNDSLFEYKALTTEASINNRNYLKKLLTEKDKENYYLKLLISLMKIMKKI